MGVGFCMTHGRYSPDTANFGCPQCVALNQRLSQLAGQMPTVSPERRTLNAGFRCKCRELFRLADCPDHIDRLQRDSDWIDANLGDVPYDRIVGRNCHDNPIVWVESLGRDA